MHKNFTYDFCRVRQDSVLVTPSTSAWGASAWTYDGITASSGGSEYANGNDYGRNYSARTARWKAILPPRPSSQRQGHNQALAPGTLNAAPLLSLARACDMIGVSKQGRGAC